MTASRRRSLMAALALGLIPAAAQGDEAAEARDPDPAVTLFAEAPEVVTPDGVAMADDGRGFAVESPTHSPSGDSDRFHSQMGGIPDEFGDLDFRAPGSHPLGIDGGLEVLVLLPHHQVMSHEAG